MNLELLERGLTQYREDQVKLMTLLGERFGYNIQDKQEYLQLISRANKMIPRKGKISERWNYAFHGGECNFYNKKHQQTVEVVLINYPIFGFLDAWFVKIYLESTTPFKVEFKDVDMQKLKGGINQLYENGKIKEVKRDY